MRQDSRARPNSVSSTSSFVFSFFSSATPRRRVSKALHPSLSLREILRDISRGSASPRTLHCWADLVKGDLFFRSNAELRLVSATRRFFHPWRWIHAMRRCTDHWKWVFNLFRETVRLMIRYRISISNRTEGKKSFPAKNQWRRRRRIRFSGRKREGEK